MSNRLQKILCLAALLFPPLYLFAPALFKGLMLWGGDIETLALPFNTSVRTSLAAGEWPGWMPDILGGMPGIAATNLVFLYPTEFLIHMLGIPPKLGLGLDAAIQLFIALSGMFLFCRALGLSRAAALIGAAAFGLSGSQLSILYAGHINNIKAIALIPWTFWAVLAGMKDKNRLAWALGGAALALQILGIGMQIFAYNILGIAAYALWLAWINGKSRVGADLVSAHGINYHWKIYKTAIIGLGIAALFASLISAPQLLPSLEYKGYSWREGFSYEAFTSWSFHPKEALGWIVPGFFGWRFPTYVGDWPLCLSSEYLGLLPWGLACAALAATWKVKRGPVRFFAILAGVSFMIGLGKWTPLHYIFYKLPIYSGFRTWTRFLCLMTFAVSVLAAFGWKELAEEGSVQARKGLLIFCGLSLVIAIVSLVNIESVAAGFADRLSQAGSNTDTLLKVMRDSSGRAIALLLVLGWLAWGLPKIKAATPVALALLPMMLFFHWFDMSDMHTRYIEHRDAAAITAPPASVSVIPKMGIEPFRILPVPGLWQQNRAMFYGLENVMGYHGVQMAGHQKLMAAMHKRQTELFNLLNMKYVLTKSPMQVPGWKSLYEQGPYVYENTRALPRAYLVTQTRKVADNEAAFAEVARDDFNPRLEAVVENGAALAGGIPLGSVTWMKRTPNAFSLEVHSPGEVMLVVSQSWYPGWKAFANGREVSVERVNGSLQGIRLGQGSWDVAFKFTSGMLNLGLWLCLVGLLGLGTLGWIQRRKI